MIKYPTPMPFQRYIELYGYESLWDYPNKIPDYVKDEIRDHFLFRYIGSNNPDKFKVWFKHVTQLKEAKFLELLKAEFIEFDPLVQSYSFEQYFSENNVDREGSGYDKTDGTSGGTTTVSGSSESTTENTTSTDSTGKTLYNSGSDTDSRVESSTTDSGKGENNTRNRTINSQYPQSNVETSTGQPLDTIDYRFASSSDDTAGKSDSTTSGTSTSESNSNVTSNRFGNDTTTNTGTTDSVGKNTSTTGTTTSSDGLNESSSNTSSNETIRGKNRHTAERQGRGILPQDALERFRIYVFNSNALEWLLRQYEPTFYGFFEETEVIYNGHERY